MQKQGEEECQRGSCAAGLSPGEPCPGPPAFAALIIVVVLGRFCWYGLLAAHLALHLLLPHTSLAIFVAGLKTWRRTLDSPLWGR